MQAVQEANILRFTTVGSVDDGKSTLIGRLLFDSKNIFEDQLAAVEKTSSKKGFQGIDLSLLTDGLAAEREQGITIDVAYRYFSTPKRKFIIADTPGHEQYTRNMVTGASTADLTIILVDARKGIQAQSRRHALISSLLGIPNFIVAINKMDLVDFSEAVYKQIVEDFELLISKLDFRGKSISYVPVSALLGHNVVERTQEEDSMPWYQGPTIMDILEKTDTRANYIAKPFRFPVQYVLRVDNNEYQDFRGFAGTLAAGLVNVGDSVKTVSSGWTSKIKSIIKFEGEQACAQAGDAVTLVLEDEIDISRGDMLVAANDDLQPCKEFRAVLCWMTETPLQKSNRYLLKHTTNKVKAIVSEIEYQLDINSYEQKATDRLGLNDIASVKIKLQKPIYADSYAVTRDTGSFILVDEISNNTVAAGMIEEIF